MYGKWVLECVNRKGTVHPLTKFKAFRSWNEAYRSWIYATEFCRYPGYKWMISAKDNRGKRILWYNPESQFPKPNSQP